MSFFLHPKGICESEHIGDGTSIWAFAHVLPGAKIGSDCNVCDGVFIENDVVVGDRVTVKCGVQLWDGIRVEDSVFIGPNVTFSNDSFPRSKEHDREIEKTVIDTGASIGVNSTILPGIHIGRKSMIGAGTVVTRDVPPEGAAPTGWRSSREQLRRDAGAPVSSSDGMQELPWAAPTGGRSSRGQRPRDEGAPAGSSPPPGRSSQGSSSGLLRMIPGMFVRAPHALRSAHALRAHSAHAPFAPRSEHALRARSVRALRAHSVRSARAPCTHRSAPTAQGGEHCAQFLHTQGWAARAAPPPRSGSGILAPPRPQRAGTRLRATPKSRGLGGARSPPGRREHGAQCTGARGGANGRASTLGFLPSVVQASLSSSLRSSPHSLPNY